MPPQAAPDADGLSDPSGQYIDSAHGCGALKFRMLPRATAVPGWQYWPGGQGTGRLKFAP